MCRRSPRGSGPILRSFIASDPSLYLSVVCILSLVALHGLHHSGYYAAGDIWPAPFMPGNTTLQQSLSLWGTLNSGLGSPQYQPFGVVQGFWGIALRRIGFAGSDTQFLWMAASLVWQGLGVTCFVRAVLPAYPLAAVAAGLGLPLSLYNAIIFPYPVQAFAVGYISLCSAYVLYRARRPASPLQEAAEVSALSDGLMVLAQTPPIAVVFAVWIAIWTAAVWSIARARRRVWLGPLLGMAGAALLNCWWLYAAYLTLFSGDGAVRQVYAGPSDLEWVSSRASPMNLLTMQGIWSWPRPEYYPWAGAFGVGILHLSPAVPLGLALCALLLSSFRRTVLALAALTVAAVLIGKGPHAPFGDLNRAAYQHLPLFWLLRDPQVEMDVLIGLFLYTLAGVGLSEGLRRLDSLLLRVRRVAPPVRLMLPPAARAIGCALLCLSGYPILSGSFLPDHWLGGISSTFVQLPSYWNAAASYLNAASESGSVVVLPADDYYQMPYTWGYYGADQIAQSFIHRPVFYLTSFPTYLAGSAALQHFLDLLSAEVRDQSPVSIAPTLDGLGIRWLLVRGDLRSHFLGRPIESGDQVVRYLARQSGIEYVRSFGKLALYRTHRGTQTVQFYNGAGTWTGGAVPAQDAATSARSSDIPWVAEPPVHAHPSSALAYGEVRTITPRASYLPIPSAGGTLLIRPRSVAIWARWGAVNRLLLRLTGPRVISGGHTYGYLRPLSLSLSRPLHDPAVVTLGFAQLAFGATLRRQARMGWTYIGTLPVPTDSSRAALTIVTQIAQVSPSHTDGEWSVVGDCNRYDSRSLRQVGITRFPGDGSKVTLTANDHAACVTLGGTYHARTGDRLLAAVRYRWIGGSLPRAALEIGSSLVVPVTLRPTADHVWHQTALWEPIDGTGSAHIYVYADGNGTGASSSEYMAGRMLLMRTVGRSVVDLSELRISAASGPIALALAAPEHAWLGGRHPAIQSELVWAGSQVLAPLAAGWGEEGTGYRAVVPAGSALLVVRTSFASGWKITSGGKQLRWPHIAVDGTLNGWLVPRNAPAIVHIDYAPELLFHRLQHVAAITLLVCLGILGRALLLHRFRRLRRCSHGATTVPAGR